MAEGFKRGEAGSQVNSWMPSSNASTPNGFTSSILPYGLQLRQTINAGTTSVTIPAGITFVYAIAVGGGGGGGGGGAGGVAWGWTLATSSCVVGTGGTAGLAGGYSRYGNVIAGGGNFAGSAGGGTGVLGGAGGGGGNNNSGGTGGTSYWGVPGGAGFHNFFIEQTDKIARSNSRCNIDSHPVRINKEYIDNYDSIKWEYSKVNNLTKHL